MPSLDAGLRFLSYNINAAAPLWGTKEVGGTSTTPPPHPSMFA